MVDSATQRVWFQSWNADNQAAREAYDELRVQQETVAQCKNKLHDMTEDNTDFDPRGWNRCLACYRAKNRRTQRKRAQRLRNALKARNEAA